MYLRWEKLRRRRQEGKGVCRIQKAEYRRQWAIEEAASRGPDYWIS
jgi:hypothetical protein